MTNRGFGYVTAETGHRSGSVRRLPYTLTIGFAIVGRVEEWDIYQTDEVAAWLQELQDSDPKTADLVDDAIYTLSRSGPALGRPLVDTITNSRVANLKELRPGSRGRSEIRILFVFDP